MSGSDVTSLPRRRARTAVILSAGGEAPNLASLAVVRELQAQSLAESTRRGYLTHWNTFVAWCAREGYAPLPAEPLVVALYLGYAAALVDADGNPVYVPDTLGHWLGSINKAHALAGFAKPGADPEVTTTMDGIRRVYGVPPARKTPLLLGELRRTLSAVDLTSWPHGVIGHRDQAILLMGFTGAFRRSELAGLQLRDIRWHAEDGLYVTLRRSKTDQEGEGKLKALPYGANPLTCPPCAFARWTRVLAAADRPERMRVLRAASTDTHICRDPRPELSPESALLPVFRPVMKNGAVKDRPITGNVVNDVVKRRVAAVGLNPAAYGAHSLRAGFVTQAFRAGATHHEVMRQTNHTDVATLEIYSRDNAPLLHNAVTRLGL